MGNMEIGMGNAEYGIRIYPGDPVPSISAGLTHEKDYCHIVENLCNLDKIKQCNGFYSFLPLKLKDSDGSPIRAVFYSL